MTKIFYDHLIIIEEVVAVLDTHDLTSTQKQEFLDLIDQTMHQDILNTILTLLPREHHETFLAKFHASPGDHLLMTFLKEHSPADMEKEILKSALKVKKQILKEIEQSKI
jgi:hypothetical protein